MRNDKDIHTKIVTRTYDVPPKLVICLASEPESYYAFVSNINESNYRVMKSAESINSPPSKILKYYSDIENKYLLVGVLNILYEEISRLAMAPVVLLGIDEKIRGLASFIIIETSESEELYNCQLQRQGNLNNPEMRYIVFSKKNTKISLPCMQHAAILYENLSSKEILKEINRMIRNHSKDDYSNIQDFTKGKCQHQQQCQRRMMLPIEYDVISNFVSTANLNEAAERLSITPKVASYYKRSAMEKLDISNNNELYDFVRKYL